MYKLSAVREMLEFTILLKVKRICPRPGYEDFRCPQRL